MEIVCRWIDRISSVSGVIAAWLIVPLIGAMCYEVIARYVFGAPTIWAYELTYLLTGAGWLLGMAYTLSRGAHIRIDVVYLNLSPRAAGVDRCGLLRRPASPLPHLADFRARRSRNRGVAQRRADGRVGLEPAAVALPRRLLRQLRVAVSPGDR